MKRLWTAGGLLLLGATSLQAQSGAPRPSLNDAGFPQRRISVSLNGRLQYDSNVLRGFQGPAGASHKSDIIATPSIDLDIVQPISRQDVFLSGSVGYSFYRYNKRLERERIDLTGGAHLRAGQSCTATPAVSYQRALSDLGDLVNVVGGLQTRSNTQETIDYGIDATCGGKFGLTGSGGYHHQTIRNSAPTRQALNVRSDIYNASIGLASGRLGTILAYGTYYTGEYPDRIPGGLFDPGDGIRTYSGGVRYERQLGNFFYASVSGGLTRVSPRNASVKDFKGLSYSGDISYTRDPLNLKIGFSRDAQQSNLIQSAYSISSDVSATLQYALSDRLRLIGSGLYGRRRFIQPPGGLPGVNPRLNDTTYYGSLGLTYLLKDGVTLGTDFAYEVRNADPSVFDYTSKQASVFVRIDI